MVENSSLRARCLRPSVRQGDVLLRRNQMSTFLRPLQNITGLRFTSTRSEYPKTNLCESIILYSNRFLRQINLIANQPIIHSKHGQNMPKYIIYTINTVMWDKIPRRKGLTIIFEKNKTPCSTHFGYLSRSAPPCKMVCSISCPFSFAAAFNLTWSFIWFRGTALKMQWCHIKRDCLFSLRHIGPKSTTATPAAPECEHASLGHWQLVPGLPPGAHKNWNSIAKLLPGNLWNMSRANISIQTYSLNLDFPWTDWSGRNPLTFGPQPFGSMSETPGNALLNW